MAGQIATAEASLLQFSRAHPALRCLLLTDPALRDPQAAWAAIHPAIAHRRRPIDVHESLFPAHHRPCLYALDLGAAADRALLRASLHMVFEDWQPEQALQGLGHRVCGWLWIAADLTDALVAAHFGTQVVQYDLARDRRILLRYFDPRVLDLIWPAFSPAQRISALGPVHAWHFVDRGQTLGCLTNPGDPALHPVERLVLTTTDWDRVRRIGLINQTLARWQGVHCQPVPALLPAAVDEALRQSALYGLGDDLDRIEFAWLAVTRHVRFAEHPAVQPIWAAVRDGEDFIAALAALGPAQWQRIVTSPTAA
jgi:hypothetical protein